MKIRMTQPEIAAILLDHICSTVAFKEGVKPTIDFTATRGDEGIVAEVDIPYMGVSSLPSLEPNATAPAATDKSTRPTRVARAATAATSNAKDTNLFAGLTAPTAEAQDAGPEAAGQEGTSEDTSPESSPEAVPTAEAPKSLFGV